MVKWLSMSERNRCIESGCKGFCCQDIDLKITKAEIKELFPKAVRVSSVEELGRIKRTRIGLFYMGNYERPGLEGPNFCLMAINGFCPNRAKEGNCNIHDIREHAARKEHGLGPIYLEPVE